MGDMVFAEVKDTAEETDLIKLTSQEIENMGESDVVDRIKELNDITQFNYFQLGGYLSVVQDNKWFGDCGNFREWCESETEVSYRKAAYLTNIYKTLVAADIRWDQVSHLGWGMLVKLLPVLNAENVVDWVEKVEGLNALQIGELVKAHQNEQAGLGEDNPIDPTSVSTLTFKLHEDQKEVVDIALDKAKNAGGTDNNSVALAWICYEYGATPTPVGKTPKNQGSVSLAEAMTTAGWEQTLAALKESFPEQLED